jgi:hypothetical protein
MDPIEARKTWRTLEPLHGMIYFAPEADEAFTAIGLEGQRMGYFASRSAAMGAVPAEVVVATFFNFCPALVHAVIPAAWEAATPTAVLAARLRAVDSALRRTLGDGSLASPELAEAAKLARRAAEAACDHPQGRPLFAGHAALGWPDEPHLVLWHAQTLLREFRGDGHVAALLLDGLSGIDALVVHAATGEVPGPVLQSSRGWPDTEWEAAVDGLRSRGTIAPGEPLSLTDAGRERRRWVEEITDQRAVVAYEPLGEDGCHRLRELGRVFSRAVVDAGALAVDRLARGA